MTIDVRPGWRAGTKVTFPREGNEHRCGAKPGDVVALIKEAPHPRFSREGSDLHTPIRYWL